MPSRNSAKGANASTPGALEKKPDIADWFYLPAWKQTAPIQFLDGREPLDETGPWVVLANQIAMGSRIIERLQRERESLIVRASPPNPRGLRPRLFRDARELLLHVGHGVYPIVTGHLGLAHLHQRRGRGPHDFQQDRLRRVDALPTLHRSEGMQHVRGAELAIPRLGRQELGRERGELPRHTRDGRAQQRRGLAHAPHEGGQEPRSRKRPSAATELVRQGPDRVRPWP